MKKETIEEAAYALLAPIAGSLSMKLVDVEYLKENDQMILRATIDKEGGVGIDDCETASRAFEQKLDEKDLIRDAYTFEVSSPGLGRPIKRPRDFDYALQKEVEAHTYSAIDKKKEFIGILTAFDDESVTIETDEGERILPRKALSKLNLTFDF